MNEATEIIHTINIELNGDASIAVFFFSLFMCIAIVGFAYNKYFQ